MVVRASVGAFGPGARVECRERQGEERERPREEKGGTKEGRKRGGLGRLGSGQNLARSRRRAGGLVVVVVAALLVAGGVRCS